MLNTSSSGTCVGADLVEHLAHRVDLAVRVGGAGVDDVHQVVGPCRDLERALEALDQTVRQAADEPDGVGEQHRLTAGQREPTRRRVERGEQPVLDEHARAGQLVEQRRLAGVRVADDGDRRRARSGRDPCAAAIAVSARSVRSRSSLLMRRMMRRRSISSFVSPPPNRAPTPPRCCDSLAFANHAAAAAGGSAAAPVRPAPCPRACGRSGRRCRGSPRCGRSRCGRAASPG